MISILRKRQLGEICNPSCVMELLNPQRIKLSNLIKSTPSLRNSVFLGFAKKGKFVIAINDECVVLCPYVPFTDKPGFASDACINLTLEENGSLLDKRVLILVHTESCLVATLLFHDTLEIDRTVYPDVGIRIFDGPNLICERLIHARESGHRVYENYAQSAGGLGVFVINGGQQIFFYLVLARAHDETSLEFTPGPSTQSDNSSYFDQPRNNDSSNDILQEYFPCRSKWYWNSASTCTCEDCLATKDLPSAAGAGTPSILASQAVPQTRDDSSSASSDDREGIRDDSSLTSQLRMEAEMDCDLLAMHLLGMSFGGIMATGNMEVPGHLIFTETRILCPCLPRSSSFIPTGRMDMSPPAGSASSSFHAVLGLCMPHNGKVLYIVWQLSLSPWNGRVQIFKVEDLVSFCKRMQRRGRESVLRCDYESHAEYLADAVDQYAEFVARKVNDVAVALHCNDLYEEFRSPALDGTTSSVLEIEHPVYPISVYNDELYEEF